MLAEPVAAGGLGAVQLDAPGRRAVAASEDLLYVNQAGSGAPVATAAGLDTVVLGLVLLTAQRSCTAVCCDSCSTHSLAHSSSRLPRVGGRTATRKRS